MIHQILYILWGSNRYLISEINIYALGEMYTDYSIYISNILFTNLINFGFFTPIKI